MIQNADVEAIIWPSDEMRKQGDARILSGGLGVAQVIVRPKGDSSARKLSNQPCRIGNIRARFVETDEDRGFLFPMSFRHLAEA
ncbi:hypothetical protein [Bradyrhizobium genosp. P]|uniref:hypothetical protein n=1 Tax=Bradyrhizobium genosp. P TaxID=83641 RepID=UPI003CF0F32E